MSAALGMTAGRNADELIAQKNRPDKNSNTLVNAYYFRAHMYTLVPDQIRDDMKWMADIGTDAVSVAVIEQDLFAAVENIEIICKEAQKAGMSVFAVPSRWAGMVAGAPKVPSIFSVQNPQTWAKNEKNQPVWSSVSGVISSVHYPEVLEFFCDTAKKMFRLWDIKGIIWDEPKGFIRDFSAGAKKNIGRDVPFDRQVKSVCDFFGKVNKEIKNENPDRTTSLFAYANLDDDIIRQCAEIEHLDYFGCDGRPWRNEDGGKQEGRGKVLLGSEAGERFIPEAHKNGKKSLMLAENHNMNTEDNRLMDKRLPEVLSLDIDQLIYYYYPRNLEKPHANMEIIKKHIRSIK